jgi:hypothetical protein
VSVLLFTFSSTQDLRGHLLEHVLQQVLEHVLEHVLERERPYVKYDFFFPNSKEPFGAGVRAGCTCSLRGDI